MAKQLMTLHVNLVQWLTLGQLSFCISIPNFSSGEMVLFPNRVGNRPWAPSLDSVADMYSIYSRCSPSLDLKYPRWYLAPSEDHTSLALRKWCLNLGAI